MVAAVLRKLDEFCEGLVAEALGMSKIPAIFDNFNCRALFNVCLLNKSFFPNSNSFTFDGLCSGFVLPSYIECDRRT